MYGECQVSAYVHTQVKLQSYSCTIREGRSKHHWDYFCQLHCIKQKIIYSVLATESNQTLFCSHNSSNTVTFLSPTSVFLSKALPHVGTTLHFFFQQISKTVRRFSDQKTSKRKSFQNMSLLSLVNRTVQTLESEVGADWRIMTHRKWCGGRESDPDPCSEDSSLQY